MINLMAMGSGWRNPASHRRRYLSSTMAAGILVFGIASSAHAIPITLEFTATDFPPLLFSGTPSPVESVSGVIVYEAAALGETIDSLISISLDIGNDSFTLADIGFISPFGIGDLDIIGGLSVGVSAIRFDRMDFLLEFNRVAGTGFQFWFAPSERPFGIWKTMTFSHFSLSSAPVSIAEPSVLSLLMLGLAGALVVRRRRFTAIH